MDDWLDLYLHYTRHQASPALFHKWAGIGVLGAAMERRTWLTRGYERLRVYPGQLMIVLVGKSALEKKTTACDFATDLLTHLAPWQLHVLPAKTSPQKLLKLLARHDADGIPMAYPEGHPLAGHRVNSTGFINAGELAGFFSTDSFNEGLATLINTMNDAKNGHVPIDFMSWQVELWNPCIGMLGAITPKGIAAELPKAARTAGFFGRILWVHSQGGSRPNALTDRIVEEKEQKKVLRRGIDAITEMRGPFVFSKQGKSFFESWFYDEYVPYLERLDAADLLDSTGYWGRKDSHVLRVGMVVSAARSRGTERVLRRVDLEKTLKLFAEIEPGFALAMAEIGVGVHAEENARLLGFIEKTGLRMKDGWVARKKLQEFGNRMGMRQQHLEDALSRLRMADEVEQEFRDGRSFWRRVWSQGELMRQAREER